MSDIIWLLIYYLESCSSIESKAKLRRYCCF